MIEPKFELGQDVWYVGHATPTEVYKAKISSVISRYVVPLCETCYDYEIEFEGWYPFIVGFADTYDLFATESDANAEAKKNKKRKLNESLEVIAESIEELRSRQLEIETELKELDHE